MSALMDGAAQSLAPFTLLALAAFGLLAGQSPGWRLRTLLAFAAGLLTGAFAIALAWRDPPAAMALLALAAIVGLILAIARPPPPGIVLTLAFLGGAALMLSAPPQATTIPAAIAAQIGTGIAALALSGTVALVAAKAKHGWQRIGTRIAGSWIAASAILVLALRLTR